MDNYMSYLMQQFIDAKGYYKKDLSKSKFLKNKMMNEFANWIVERENIGKDYLKLLKNMNIEFDNYKCAEIGKGSFDSTFMNSNCTIITPYTKGFENMPVVDSDFEVVNGKPSFSNYNGSLLKGLIINNIDTYITQNVYNPDLIQNWDKLIDNGLNIIVGVYGNKSDKDIEMKINILENLKKSICDSYEGFSINTNSYCYFITNKRR